MTYSIVARCKRTGQYGVAVSTYSPRVGATVPLVISNRCAVAFQSVTSPDMRNLTGKLLATGACAEGVLKELETMDRFWERRQVSIVDSTGFVAAFTGSEFPAIAEHRIGKGFAVAGNVVTKVCVTDTFEAFEDVREADLPLAEKLMRGLEAGARSGGQEEGLTSAALLVHDRYSFPIVDLRVDVHDTPVIELRKVWEFCRPMIEFDTQRSLDPTGFGRWWQYRMDKCPDWKPNHLVRKIPQQ